MCAPERGTGAPLGMRPRRCAQARVCPSAKASRYRVASPRAGRPVRRRRGPTCRGDPTREVRTGSASLQCAYVRLRWRIPQGAPAPGFAEPCSAVRGRTSLRFAPRLRRISPLLFVRTLAWSSNICAANSEALHKAPVRRASGCIEAACKLSSSLPNLG